MLLLELAFQGIRDLPAAQLKLRPNANAIIAPPPAAEALVRALERLVGGRDTVAVAQGAPLAQGAATLIAADRAIFRLARDLVTGHSRLWSYATQARSYTPVSEDTAEVAQFLQSRVGLCDADTFARVFVFAARQLPSRARLGPDRRAPSGHDSERRLAEIEAQLVLAGSADALELELDDVQKRRFAVEDELHELGDPDAEIARAQAALARFAAVPPDIAERYQAYLRQVTRRDGDLARWEDERMRVAREGPREARKSVTRSPWLWAGLGVGLLGAALGIAMGGQLRFLALLDIPGLGVAAAILWRHFESRDLARSRDRRLALLDERRQKILARDAGDIQAVEQQLAALGLETADEVQAVVTGRRQAEEALRLAFSARAESGAEVRRQALAREKAVLDAEIATLEEALLRAGAGVNRGALRAEAAALRTADPRTAAAPVPPLDLPQLVAELVRLACDLWLVGKVEAQELLERRASAALQAMTAGQLASVAVSPAPSVTTPDGQTYGLAELPEDTRDTVYVALRVALVRGCDDRTRMPVVVIDDPGAGWMPGVVFAELAPGAQVLLVTSDATRVPPGTPALRLGT